MDGIWNNLGDFRGLEASASGSSAVHRLNPLAKLLATIAYLVATTSIPRYAFPCAVGMAIFPVILFALANLSFATCLRRLRFVLPFVLLVGVANPFFDRGTMFSVGGVEVSGGIVSMATLALKGALCLAASYALAATTRMDALCSSLAAIRVPAIVTDVLLLSHRYLAVLMEEAGTMAEAYALRAPRARGVKVGAWGSFLGQLLLRAMDKAHGVHDAMMLRGFSGTIPMAATPRWRATDTLFLACAIALVACLRVFNVAEWIGALVR